MMPGPVWSRASAVLRCGACADRVDPGGFDYSGIIGRRSSPAFDRRRDPLGNISEQVRQLDRELPKPGILLKQQYKVPGIPVMRFIDPESGGLIQQRRQHREKFFVSTRRFSSPKRRRFPGERQHVVGISDIPGSIAAGLMIWRVSNGHGKSLAGKRPQSPLQPTVSSESEANLSRKAAYYRPIADVPGPPPNDRAPSPS